MLPLYWIAGYCTFLGIFGCKEGPDTWSFLLYVGITLSNKSVRKHAVGSMFKSHAYVCAGMIINSGKPLKFTHSKEEQEVKRKKGFLPNQKGFPPKIDLRKETDNIDPESNNSTESFLVWVSLLCISNNLFQLFRHLGEQYL